MGELEITADDIHALLEGLGIMGTGGGGNPDWGRMILEQDLAQGRTWHIIDPEDVTDTATVVSGGIMGSVKALESIGFENVLDGWETYFPLGEVTKVMEQLLDKPIDAVVAFESGGLNTPVILSLGARLGIPVVDGDALGRSAPETNMTSFIGHGIAIPPMPLIDQYGNVVVVQAAVSPTYPDEIGRFVVNKGGHMGANNHYPMTGAQLKQAVIPNTIRQALELGRLVHDARTNHHDPIQTIGTYLGASVAFSGTITALREEERMGFYFTTVDLKNGATHAQLVIKNETMLFRLNEDIICMFPDIALMLEPGTGRGLMSVELHEGLEMAILALPCHPRLQAAAQTEIGRVAMSPSRFGQTDLVYEPMKDMPRD